MFDELRQYVNRGSDKAGGFLPAVKQIANVAGLPGIVKHSIAMPDVHAGYGFAIGNVAAFDMEDPNAVVSPGGVGFDINCGVRLIRTNLNYKDVKLIQSELAQTLFDHIPVGMCLCLCLFCLSLIFFFFCFCFEFFFSQFRNFYILGFPTHGSHIL